MFFFWGSIHKNKVVCTVLLYLASFGHDFHIIGLFGNFLSKFVIFRKITLYFVTDSDPDRTEFWFQIKLSGEISFPNGNFKSWLSSKFLLGVYFYNIIIYYYILQTSFLYSMTRDTATHLVNLQDQASRIKVVRIYNIPTWSIFFMCLLWKLL